MLNNINDLLAIDSEIEEVKSERSKLADQLKKAEQKTLKDSEKNALYRDITEKLQLCIDSEDVKKLRIEFGDLKIFDECEQKFNEIKLIEDKETELDDIKGQLDKLALKDVKDLSFYEIAIMYENLKSIEESHILIDNPTLTITLDAFDRKIVSTYAEHLLTDYNQQLFNTKWDTEYFSMSDSDAIDKINKTSSLLFKLTKLCFNQDSAKLWNFVAMANNFKVRFTYHFHNDASTINLYFKFLNDYLKNNLYKCISIFEDTSVGLTKQLIHEQFINHVLDPIREKINAMLLKNDIKTFIALISQIISTDKNLMSTFFYRGKGLISLVSDSSWEKWLEYEVLMSKKQYNTITKSAEELNNSAQNFCKLLRKVYDYLEPFYELDYPNLEGLKLKTCSKIFLQLFNDYLDFVMTCDALGENHSKENELQQTLIKLQSVAMVRDKIYELSQQFVFVELTNVVNEREDKRYITIFQDVLDDYERNIRDDLQNAIIHRVQKMMKDSLQGYFKVNTWVLTELPEDEKLTPTPEVISCISLLKRVISNLDSIGVSYSVTLKIKDEILNRIVNYFVESILKLNKFNQQGLKQFEIDYTTVRHALNLPDNFENAQDQLVFELLKLLSIKYNDSMQKYVDKTYIKTGDFSDIINEMSLNQLEESEIQDALYRILLNNIV
ncbi:Tip20 protein [Maudiozyma humilis]|uniref:Tip20 protein n=1 Tax=Maudiozyma humilis TaxID=51915 RepID=A0AAV5RT95_MAUHU|nr:Tip20 protein [Kazachstania humilis]